MLTWVSFTSLLFIYVQQVEITSTLASIYHSTRYIINPLILHSYINLNIFEIRVKIDPSEGSWRFMSGLATFIYDQTTNKIWPILFFPKIRLLSFNYCNNIRLFNTLFVGNNISILLSISNRKVFLLLFVYFPVTLNSKYNNFFIWN